MFIDQLGHLYTGDMRVGDREATPEEVAAWQLASQPSQAALAKAAQDARDDALVQAIAAMTPAELMQHIDTTFPSMTVAQRRVLKVLAKMARISANRL